MDIFETLFGINATSVKPTCVLLPYIKKGVLESLGVERLSRGSLYGAVNSRYFTVIHTRTGPAFLGDAVLYLGDTACRNVILLGSCGSAGNEDGPAIGSLVSPFKCYAAESFSRLLINPLGEWNVFYANGELHKLFMGESNKKGVREATCLSIGSLKLQEENIAMFRKRGVEVFDMECASLYAASRLSRSHAIALLYVTDIVGEKPFYRRANVKEKASISSAVANAARMIGEFAKRR